MTKQLNFTGDRTSDIVGQVVGPTTYGQFLTVIAADYDETADTTAAHLRPSTVPEIEAARESSLLTRRALEEAGR